MRILLVGGLGFIGLRFIKKFSSHYELIVFTKEKSTTDNKNELNVFQIENGVIEDNTIHDVIKKHKPDVVIHLAALTGLQKCEQNPQDAFKVNVFGTYNVVKACVETNSKLIFISSREVYGNTLNNESKEDDPLFPNNVYGITKMLGEELVKLAGQKNDLDYTILRLTNVYGPEGGSRGVNNMIKTAILEKRIQINGGDQFLNIIYVDDVVDLIKLVIHEKRSSKQIFNVGSKEIMTIKDFAEKVSKLLDKDISFEYLPIPEMESSKFRPSLEKLEKILGFSTKTPLKEGLEATIKWYVQNKNNI